MSTTDAFLEQLHRRLAANARVEAAWLSGSFGRGDADRYSDIDLNLLLAEGGDSFRRDIEAFLHALRPLVLYTLLVATGVDIAISVGAAFRKALGVAFMGLFVISLVFWAIERLDYRLGNIRHREF